MSYQQTIDDLDDELVFGKHKGWTIGEVIDGEPQYANWLAEEEIVDFSDAILDEIRLHMNVR